MSEWEVIAARAHNPGDAADGAEEQLLVRGSEAEARRVFADTVAEAAGARYDYVRLRDGQRVVQAWPQSTGWTS
ncbi:hypothetical protein BCA37_15500 [Mycobacterium sp. djl-10]|nr:hypothetical protein BCA37_15500 [Mycobacterium sp. djl-10]